MACASGTVAVPRLRMPDLGDGGYDFSGYPHRFEAVVPGHVVGHHAEEWSQCPGAAAGVGPEAVPDSFRPPDPEENELIPITTEWRRNSDFALIPAG